MKAFIFTSVAGMSLLLGLTGIAVWINSYWYWDRVYVYYDDPVVVLSSGQGSLAVEVMTNQSTGRQKVWKRIPKSRTAPADVRYKYDWDFLGFGYKRDVVTAPALLPQTTYTLAAPHWAFAGVTCILPTIWVTKRIRKQRKGQEGKCKSCGYDLRASRERCSECGTAIPEDVGESPSTKERRPRTELG